MVVVTVAMALMIVVVMSFVVTVVMAFMIAVVMFLVVAVVMTLMVTMIVGVRPTAAGRGRKVYPDSLGDGYESGRHEQGRADPPKHFGPPSDETPQSQQHLRGYSVVAQANTDMDKSA